MEEKDEIIPINFNSRSKKIISVDWNESGKYLATSSSDSVVRIWDYSDNDLFKVFDLKGHDSKSGQVTLKWHPTDENIIATAGYDKTLKIYDTRVSTKNSLDSVLNEKTKESNVNLCWHPEGNMIAVSNMKEEVSFYDYKTWKLIKTVSFMEKKWELNDLAWDNTGTFLFIPNTTGNVYALNGIDLELDSLLEIKAHFGTAFCVAISNNNNYFATGSADSNILLWDMYELACIKSMQKNDSIINQLSFNHDDRFLAAACNDEVQKKYNIDIYDIENETMVYTLPSKGVKRTVSWHPKLNVLAYGGKENKQGIISFLTFNK